MGYELKRRVCTSVVALGAINMQLVPKTKGGGHYPLSLKEEDQTVKRRSLGTRDIEGMSRKGNIVKTCKKKQSVK